MGTRSRIAMQQSDGTFLSIYCHWDGYLSHNGAILHEHYQDPDKVKALIDLGSLSSLRPEIGVKHDFDKRSDDQCTFYGRDRGEKDCEAVSSETLFDLKELTQETGGEYLYLFRKGVWEVAEGGIAFFGMPADEAPQELKLLSDALAEEESQ